MGGVDEVGVGDGGREIPVEKDNVPPDTPTELAFAQAGRGDLALGL